MRDVFVVCRVGADTAARTGSLAIVAGLVMKMEIRREKKNWVFVSTCCDILVLL